MTRLIWDQTDERKYEFGVDHGVFYFQKDLNVYGDGVVWNGLISVEESNVGGELASYHFDGIKYLDTVNPKTYQLRITTYSVPHGFKQMVGEEAIIPGVILTRQARGLFGFSYRTFMGENKGYKIHLVYNALAKPIKRVYSSLSESAQAEETTWAVDAVPPPSDIYRPSAHLILDSTKLDPKVLGILEDVLYGTAGTMPRLPTIPELITIVQEFVPVIITPDPTGGLALLVDGVGDLFETTASGLNRALPNTRLEEDIPEGLYRLETLNAV